MSQVLVTESYLEYIADAIREKNGTETTYNPQQMAAAIEALPDPSVLDSKSITANGTYDPSDDSLDGYDEVTVNVPNSYAAVDEGKVVSNGALVAQGSDTITQNGTYDTTLISSLIANISGGGGGDTLVQNPPIEVPTNSFANYLSLNNGWVGEFGSEKMCFRALNSQGSSLDVDWSDPFEICVAFMRTNTSSHAMVLFGAELGNWFFTPSVELGSNGTEISCWFSTNGSSWTNGITFGPSDGFTLQSNVKYKLTYKWDGTDFSAVLTDGTNTFTKSTTPSGAHYHTSSYLMTFGGMMRSGNHNAQYVKLYLPEMYISSKGTKVWQGQTA